MMTMLWLCICGALAAAAFWYCRKYNELYRAADGMLEQVLSEERIEISGLEEGRLSALAAKCLRVQEKLNLEIGRAQEEKEQVKKQVADYKKYYELVHQGDYYRLNAPGDGKEFVAWSFVSADKKQALFNLVITHVRANNKPIFVKLKGLDASAKYRLEDGRIISGSALMNAGISIPSVSGEFRAIQFELKAEE